MESSRMTAKKSPISPFKSQNYNKLEEDKKHIITKLLYLFTYYAAKASKYVYKELSQKYFMELMVDVYEMGGKRLVKNGHGWKNIVNIYYSKGRKNGMAFNEFLQILSMVCMHFLPDEEREESLKVIMSYLLKVYERNVREQLEGKVVEYVDHIKEDTRQFIIKLMPNFNVVYKYYFPNQISNKFANKIDPELQSFDNFIHFLKELEVFPKLISISQLYFIFIETLKAEPNNLLREGQFSKVLITEKGKIFTISKFVEALITISRNTLYRLRNFENPEVWEGRQKQMLKTLLEYMETVKSNTKKIQFQDLRFSFIVYDEYPPERYLKNSRIKLLERDSIHFAEKSINFYDMFEKMDLEKI